MNARMARLLRERGIAAVVIDVAVHKPCNRAEFLLRRLGRMVAGNLRLWAAMRGARTGAVYVALSGGWGQAVDLSFFLAARLLGARVVVHHHSFAYLDRHSALTALVLRIAGRGATHVTLCGLMKTRLQTLYGMDLETVTVPNAALLRLPDTAVDRPAVRVVSFLSNVSREKGILVFLDLAARMRDSGLRFQIGGPIADRAVKKDVLAALEALPNLAYAGPVYGIRKARFLAASDVLVFPSQYRNEADPLVIHEALAYSTPVIATDRGCVSSILQGGAGLVAGRAEDFAAAAAEQLRAWQQDDQSFRTASFCARQRCQELRGRYRNASERLFELMDARCSPGTIFVHAG